MCISIVKIASIVLMLMLSTSCARIESRHIKTVLQEREETARPRAEVDISEVLRTGPDVAFSATVSDRCRTVTHTREGEVQDVHRSWVDFAAAGTLSSAGVGFFVWGLECHNNPYSCPKERTATTATYSGGGLQAIIAIAFVATGALFAGHAIYKYARAENRLEEKTYRSSAYSCNSRALSALGAELVLSSGKIFAIDPSSDNFVFHGMSEWLIENPGELDVGSPRLKTRSGIFVVPWSEIADVAGIRREARVRQDEALAREERDRAERVQRELAAAEGRARVKRFSTSHGIEAVLTCGMEKLGDAVCKKIAQRVLGKVAGDVSCKILLQKVTTGRIDLEDAALSVGFELVLGSGNKWLSALATVQDIVSFVTCVQDRM